MAAVDIDPDRVRTLLASCRLDLAAMRHDLARSGPFPDLEGSAGIGILGAHQVDLVDRLEQVIASLELALHRIGRASASALVDGLAGEADRRAASSLRTVSALLAAQADQDGADGMGETLRNAALQVRSAAQVHESLRLVARLSGPPCAIELGGYVKSICDDYLSAPAPAPASLPAPGAPTPGAVEPVLRAYMAPVQVTPELARQLGLVVMELVGNALRHAFAAGRPGRIWVVGYRARDGRYLLCVEDDGRGLPPGFDLRNRPDGTGLGLVNLLVDRARLGMTYDGDGGAWFILAVPANRIRQAADLAW